jgi:hypothetical protein
MVNYDLIGISVERSRAWRQSDPTVSTTVVNGDSGHRKAWVSEGAHGDADRLIAALLGMEHRSAANWTESESEFSSLVPDPDVLGYVAEDFKRTRKAGQFGESTASPSLTGEAVAEPNALRFAFDLNAQLSARTRSSS